MDDVIDITTTDRTTPVEAAAAVPRLLVIDDDTVHRTVIGLTGSKLGFLVVYAESCEEALCMVRRQSYDCITLDLTLGQRSGIEVMSVLDGLGDRTPLVIISGADDKVRRGTMQQAIDHGLNVKGQLPKQAASLTSLRAILSEILAHRQAAPA